jgi:hypothetical protein
MRLGPKTASVVGGLLAASAQSGNMRRPSKGSDKMPGHYTLLEGMLAGPIFFVLISAAVVYGSLLFRRGE